MLKHKMKMAKIKVSSICQCKLWGKQKITEAYNRTSAAVRKSLLQRLKL